MSWKGGKSSWSSKPDNRGGKPDSRVSAKDEHPFSRASSNARPSTGKPSSSNAPSKPQPPTAAPSSAKKVPNLTVSSNAKKDEIGVQTLVGDYIEVGSNHGRKYYKKVQEIPGHKDVKVFLYYWDMRDGADFSGWWFGDELGGSQVWARCSSHGQVPPSQGWKIPWDAMKSEPGLLTVNPYKGGPTTAPKGEASSNSQDSRANASRPAADSGKGSVDTSALDAKVKTLSKQIDAATSTANKLIEKLKDAKQDDTLTNLQAIVDPMKPHQNKLHDMQKSLTEEINNARKGGPSATFFVTELSKLSPKLRSSITSLTAELNRVKGWITKMSTKEEFAKQKAQSQAELKDKETKHSKELAESLPEIKAVVAAALEAVDVINKMASPIIADPPDEEDSSLEKLLDQVEKNAKDAQEKLTDARQKINAKLQEARQYAPETRKKALAEYTELQGQLQPAQQTLTPLKTFKKEFAERVAARKSLAELAEKLSSAELEVEKASMMMPGEGNQMSEEDVQSAEGLVKPAQTSLNNVSKLIAEKLAAASGPMKDELSELKKRLGERKTKVDEVTRTLRSQREGLTLQTVYASASEKVDKAEESFSKCGDAELPFLKGIEVLPKEESDAAIKDSEAAAAEATKAVNAADSYIKGKLQEIKKYSKETIKTATEELEELKSRLDAVAKKLSNFKKETKERKMTALMAEAIEVVANAEAKGTSLAEVVKVFESENLDETSVATLKEAMEKAGAADKECTDAVSQARKIIAEKQRESKDKELIQSLSKLTGRLGHVQDEIRKAKKAVKTGEQLIQCKDALAEGDTKLIEVEAGVEKIVKMSKPDEAGLGVEKIEHDTILEIDSITTTITKELKSVSTLVSLHTSNAPNAAARSALSKLSDRMKAAHAKIDEVKAITKEQREQVVSEAYVKEADEKAKAAEASFEKANEAESPYLKGIEPSLEESQSCLELCDKCIAEIQELIGGARTFITSKSLEVKKFDEKNSKGPLEEFGKITERVNAVAQKLGVFKKDTAVRKKHAAVHEAIARVSVMEAEVKKVADAVGPLAEQDPDKLSAEEASKMVNELEELEKAAQSNVNDVRSFLAARARDAKEEAEKTQIKELQSKLSDAQGELRKAKKASNTQTEKIRAKALTQEAAEKLKEVEAALEKANSACAPLVEEKGLPFLVKISIETLADALLTHMSEKGISDEDMWKEIGSPLDEAKFVEFVGKVPETLKRDECEFSEERRKAMFKAIDEDGDAAVSLGEFKAMLSKQFACIQGIAVTDIFDIAASKTLLKLEKGAVVQSLGAPTKTAGENGVPRLKCKVVATGEEGWVTIEGNGGTKYLEATSAFEEFLVTLNKTLEAIVKSNLQVSNSLIQKVKDLSSVAKESPLFAAKEALTATRSKVSGLISKLDSLKRTIEQAKSTFYEAAKKEKNAHIEAREKKEADVILDVARPLILKMEAELKKLDEVSKPLLERKDTDLLEAFTTPLSVQEETKAVADKVKAAAEEAKVSVKAQQEIVAKATKGAMLEARKELSKWSSDVGKAIAQVRKAVDSVQKCCRTIASAKLTAAASTMRNWAREQNLSLDDYFAKLAAGAPKISEEEFCKHVLSLEGLDLSSEHAKLLARSLEADGVSRRAFFKAVQRFYKVVKEIAMTPHFDVKDTKDKPVRKVDMDEVLEVIDGPKTDSKSALSRVKVKACVDGAEGWVTISGNQGKVFLEEEEKPFYVALKEVPLDKEFEPAAEEPIRKLKVDEVVEVLEGPRKDSPGVSVKLRGKYTVPGEDKPVTGWVTVKDRFGVEFLQRDETSYICTATVAITDGFDIKSCKVLKKLSENEVFIVSEGPIAEESSGIKRVKGKSSKDGVEGWVTITGNAGTVYCKMNEKLWRVSKEVAITERILSDSAVVRSLEVGSMIEAIEAGTKQEKTPASDRLKIRTSDGVVGWVTVKSEALKKWSPRYKFTKAAPLYSDAKVNKETAIREVASGELANHLDGPVEVEGRLWIKLKVKKDAAVGWSPMKEEDGSRLVGQL
mmetsp:Transcript_23922/g.38200  ORF Transcript_23922/g.38200 Transcript_23922/m.38200 type:complete len:2017 (-) Transcript_23922:43-6093(-)